MKGSKVKKLTLAIIIVLALVAGGYYLFQKSQISTPPSSQTKPVSQNDDDDKIVSSKTVNPESINLFEYPDDRDEYNLEHALSDRYIGSLDAPIVFQDFSSLSCPHCATFHTKILPKIKKNFIETGQVRMIFEVMPLNKTALMGEQIARCAPKKDFYNIISLLYSNQELWAQSQNPRKAIVNLVKLAGITEAQSGQCLDDKELELALVEKTRENAREYAIRSTPTFLFNEGEKVLNGVGEYKQYDEMLRSLIAANKEE